jgi:hypothetical protein
LSIRSTKNKMSTIPLKITIANYGTRRLNVARDTPFQNFQQNVKELFGIQNELDWVYVDEENDVVTFSTDQEFIDALAVWNENKLLKLNATSRPTIQRVEQPHQSHASEQAPTSCPFSRMSCRAGNSGCTSLPLRAAVSLGLFYSIFSHPFLTLVGLITLMVVTRHHYPASYEKLSLHARTHWRKVAVAYGAYMLFHCTFCTLFFAFPIAFLLIKKFKSCHSVQNGECCYVKARDAIKNFLATHNINCCDSIDKIVNFGQGVSSVPQAQAPQQEQPQELPKSLQPSAPPLSSLYPSVSNEIVTDDILPQRVETVPFEKELETLSTMGFDNKKLNEHLLRNFNGNLDRVVTSLLQLSSMQ